MASKDSIEAGRGHVTLSVKQTELQKGLDAAQKSVQAWGKNIMGIGASISAAGAAIVAPFLVGLSTFSDWGLQTRETLRSTGISFQELQRVTAGTRTSAEDIIAPMAKMSQFLNDAAHGSREANQALAEMGITLSELQGLTQAQRLERFADGLARIGDESQRIALQRTVLGRGGLIVDLSGGSAGIQERAARHREVYGENSPADYQLALDYNKAMKEMKTATDGVWNSIGKAAAPAMMEFFQIVTKVLIAIRQWADDNRNLLNTVFRIADKLVLFGFIVVGLGGAVHALGYAFVALKYITFASTIATVAQTIALSIAKGAVIAYSAVVAACTFIVGLFTGSTWAAVAALAVLALGIGAIALVAVAVPGIVDVWIAAFNTLAPTIRTAFSGITDAISAGEWSLAVDIAWAAIMLATIQAVNSLKRAWLLFKFFFMEVWDGLTTWLAHALVDVAATVTNIFHAIATGIADVFAGIVGRIANSINELISRLPASMRTVLGIDYVSYDGDAVRREIQANANSQRQIRDARTADLHQEIDRPTDDRERRIRELAEHAAQSAMGEGLLRGNLDGLVARAARLAERAAAGGGGGGGERRQLGVESVQGAFSGAAIAGFLGSSAGGGETRAEREARMSRETLQALLRIEERRRGVVMA